MFWLSQLIFGLISEYSISRRRQETPAETQKSAWCVLTKSLKLKVLTALENARHATALSKSPSPITCRVFRLTESQTRTCGCNDNDTHGFSWQIGCGVRQRSLGNGIHCIELFVAKTKSNPHQRDKLLVWEEKEQTGTDFSKGNCKHFSVAFSAKTEYQFRMWAGHRGAQQQRQTEH